MPCCHVRRDRDNQEFYRLVASLARTTGIAKQSFASLVEICDHIGALQTVAKRAVIPPGTHTTEHG